MWLLGEITELSNYLAEKPLAEAAANDWFNRLKRIAQTWGDGWVLRQAIATVPADLDLQTLADRAGADEPTLASAASLEYHARSHNKDAQWWQQSLSSCESDLDRRHWVFSLLSIARPQAVLDVAPRLNEVVSALSPKHYAAVRYALGWLMKSSVARELVFAEPLRLRQVEVSPRLLWLIRAVGTEATIEWADRRLEAGFESLLQPGLGDMRPLLRAVGSRTTVKARQLKHSRSLLPLGGWASDIKLGALSFELAREILRDPDQWPGDLAQRAAEKIWNQARVEGLNAVRHRARRRVVHLTVRIAITTRSPACFHGAVLLCRGAYRDFAPAPGDDKRLPLCHFIDDPAEVAA